MRRTILAVGAVAAVSVLLSGCLYVSGNFTVVGPPGAAFAAYDAGDPGAVPFPPGNSAIQVYTTNDFWGGKHVPSWTWNVPSSEIDYFDALPTGPSWDTSNQYWAPSVRHVGPTNNYIMAFAGEDGSSGRFCIGFAESTNGPNNPFTALPNEICAVGGVNSNIDPYLFSNDGTLYLLWSNEHFNNSGQAAIWSQPLTVSGTGPGTVISFAPGSSEQDLMTYTTAAGIASAGNSGFDPGPSAYVENPSVVYQPSVGYDVMASVGTYFGNYWTVEETCGSLTDPGSCSGGYVVSHFGSMSMLYDDDPIPEANDNDAFFSLCYGTCQLNPFATAFNPRFVVEQSSGT